jgi:hypothetical protein
MNDLQKLIFVRRRHRVLEERSDVFDLIRLSYRGGTAYTEDRRNLDRYYRESAVSYAARLRRAVYINFIQPLVDMLTGLVTMHTPEREEVPESLAYVLDRADKSMSLDTFMRKRIAPSAMLYPTFILVDSPAFNPQAVVSEADRKAANLYPYAIKYDYREVRDFAEDDAGKLLWIFLDNSHVDNTDPFAKARKRNVYRLWTREYFQDFTIEDNKVTEGEPVPHRCGRVPGFWVNRMTVAPDEDEPNVFESVALIARGYYNTLSEMDEVIAGHSFSTLFFPIRSGDDLPASIKNEGPGALAVIPYDGELSQRPFFEGAGVIDVVPFFDKLKLYTREMFRQLGLTLPEEGRNYVAPESGRAKEIEFVKVEAILSAFAKIMSDTERELFACFAAWEGKEADVKVTYRVAFSDDDLDAAIGRLATVYAFPYQSVQRAAAKRLIKKSIPDLTPEEAGEIVDEINDTPAGVE